MRVVSGILFLSILLGNLCGLPVVFKIQQRRIRRELKDQIRSGISKDALHYFGFSKKEHQNIDWTYQKKEFRLNGDMYDVVFKKESPDSIHYYCINDKEEKKLFANLNELVNRKLDDDFNSGKRITCKLLRAITSFSFIPTECFANLSLINTKTNRFSAFINLYLPSPYLEYQVPPPKFA